MILPLGSPLCTGNLIPQLASLLHLFAVLGRGQAMTSWSEVLGDRPIRGEKSLRLPWGFAPLHAPFPLAGGLVGILRAVVEIAVLVMFHARQDLPLGGTTAIPGGR